MIPIPILCGFAAFATRQLRKTGQVAALRVGGFTRKMGASKTRADAVLDLLRLAADELGRRAPGLIGHTRPKGAAIKRAMTFVHSHSSEPVRMQDVATDAGVSRQHLARIWKKQAGIPLHAYLTMIRIDRAKLLLEPGDRKIIDVAMECGFGSLSQFNRAFLRATGVSPGRWAARRRDRRLED
ncbi:MAG: AraC family transcriptional regulator [Terrimicrobiaceae bacterium]